MWGRGFIKKTPGKAPPKRSSASCLSVASLNGADGLKSLSFEADNSLDNLGRLAEYSRNLAGGAYERVLPVAWGG
jgi:hypothetical protein